MRTSSLEYKSKVFIWLNFGLFSSIELDLLLSKSSSFSSKYLLMSIELASWLLCWSFNGLYSSRHRVAEPVSLLSLLSLRMPEWGLWADELEADEVQSDERDDEGEFGLSPLIVVRCLLEQMTTFSSTENHSSKLFSLSAMNMCLMSQSAWPGFSFGLNSVISKE